MRPSAHPSTLEDFIAGRLNEAESIAVITHLSECEACLSEADRLWAEHPAGVAQIAAPMLDPERARYLERKLLRRLHRTNLGGQAVRLTTHGLLHVLLVLLQPLFVSRRPSKLGGFRK